MSKWALICLTRHICFGYVSPFVTLPSSVAKSHTHENIMQNCEHAFNFKQQQKRPLTLPSLHNPTNKPPFHTSILASSTSNPFHFTLTPISANTSYGFNNPLSSIIPRASTYTILRFLRFTEHVNLKHPDSALPSHVPV